MTQDDLMEFLKYDPETGEFHWVKNKGRAKAGDLAGSIGALGYWQIGLFGKRNAAHRLAWLYQYGAFPDGIIDHINRDRKDNRIANLRDTNHSVNRLNTGLSKINTSGHSGVWAQDSGWVAKIGNKYLGYFKTKAGAVEARKDAEL